MSPASKRDFFMYGVGSGSGKSTPSPRSQVSVSPTSSPTSTTTPSQSPRRIAVKRKPVPVAVIDEPKTPSVEITQSPTNVKVQGLDHESENETEDAYERRQGEERKLENENRFSKYSPSVFTFNAGWSPITNDTLFWEAIGIDVPATSPTSTTTTTATHATSKRSKTRKLKSCDKPQTTDSVNQAASSRIQRARRCASMT